MRTICKIPAVATLLAMAACSDSTSSAGGETTTEGNSLTAFHIDSVLVYGNKGGAGSGIADSLNSWYEYRFDTEPEAYYKSPESQANKCQVDVYESQNGVMSSSVGEEKVLLSVVFIPGTEGFIKNELLAYGYEGDESSCVERLTNFERDCKRQGGEFLDYNEGCSLEELHVLCKREIFSANVLTVVEEQAEEYAKLCREDWR